MDDELEGLLDAAEEAIADAVAEVLQEVADEFARSLDGATEIVAARFSVSRIGRMFADRMPRVVRRLLGVAGQAAQQAADTVDAELPDGWDDLPARYDDDTLPPAMSEYVEVTEHLLRAVGERLADAARQELAAGVDAGEDVEQLRARLRERFAREGTQLGASREQLIARTESARAWNTATLEAARALTGPDRPIVKQWQTRRDTLVRDAHEDVDGQLRFLDEPFTVGEVAMQAPGDPTAPPELVCNCRCVLRLERAPAAPEPTASARARAAIRSHFPDVDDAVADAMASWNNPIHRTAPAVESQVAPSAASANPREVLDDLADRVLRPALEAAGVPNADNYRLAWDDRSIPITRDRSAMPDSVTAAADGVEHTGAMIALLPTEEDAERLALDGGEPADELHLTLFYLGEGADWNEDQRRDLIANMRTIAARHGQLTTQAFGVNYWNPGSDTPAWVWAVGDDRDAPDDDPTLHELHNGAIDALEDMHSQPDLPTQHSPWVPHVCGAYTSEAWPLDEMADRVGPITFDRIRLAFAGEHTDIPLGTPQEEAMPTSTAAGEAPAIFLADPPPAVRTWSTPGDTAIAYEDQETGDGRIFAPNALYWENGPYPLQYADEMLMGHQGAELAGAMNEVGRDGKRITSTGVLYATREAGLDAITLLEEEAPLGISVDLDDVDLEFVDRTIDPEDAEWMYARASVSAASVMRLEDGAYMLSVATDGSWATADGGTMSRRRYDIQLVTDTEGQLSAAGIRDAFAGTGALTAAAGDADDPDAVVLWSEKAGDFLVRITRARLRGATLVAMPAYSQARIVLDPVDEGEERQAAAAPIVAASGDTTARVVTYVRSSPAAVGARQVARALGIGMSTARTHLHKAAKDELIVRLSPGLFCGLSSMPEGRQDLEAALQLGVPADLERLMASTYSPAGEGPPMPAAWFAEPTEEELPPGSGGVHYADGRIFGWVAQAGEPHAGFPGRNLTIESLGKLDLTHFLRARFKLDNGSLVKAGAFTMNVGHHRDGAECETSSCQFDDTRTVAGVVTVGMNKRGLWFSGAAAPWLSEWDRTVFQACQPSYHMRQGPGGKWQLRAVLSVPVPGHSSPLLATAMVERSNLALAASAAALTAPDTTTTGRPDSPSGHPDNGAPAGPDTTSGLHGQSPDTVSGQAGAAVDELIAALLDGPFIDQLTAELERRDAERRAEIEALTAAIAPTPEEITASAALKGAR